MNFSKLFIALSFSAAYLAFTVTGASAQYQPADIVSTIAVDTEVLAEMYSDIILRSDDFVIDEVTEIAKDGKVGTAFSWHNTSNGETIFAEFVYNDNSEYQESLLIEIDAESVTYTLGTLQVTTWGNGHSMIAIMELLLG